MGPGATRDSATAAVNAILTAVLRSVPEQKCVRLPGFGTFEQKHIAAREIRLPGSSDKSHIPARSRLVFRPADSLKKELGL